MKYKIIILLLLVMVQGVILDTSDQGLLYAIYPILLGGYWGYLLNGKIGVSKLYQKSLILFFLVTLGFMRQLLHFAFIVNITNALTNMTVYNFITYESIGVIFKVLAGIVLYSLVSNTRELNIN